VPGLTGGARVKGEGKCSARSSATAAAILGEHLSRCSYIAADWGRRSTSDWDLDRPAVKLNHWLCYPAVVGWVVSYAAVPPKGFWLILSLPFPFLWWYVHRTYHKHNNKRTKRLLEAGRGLVQRFPQPAGRHPLTR